MKVTQVELIVLDPLSHCMRLTLTVISFKSNSSHFLVSLSVLSMA